MRLRNFFAALPLIVSYTAAGLMGAWVCLEAKGINDLIRETSKEVRESTKAFSRQMADDRAQHAKEWAEARETK